MAQTLAQISKSRVISNLDTYNHTALQNSMYVVECQMTEIPPSGVTIQIKQNGSTMATSVALTPTQTQVSLRLVLNCAINDIIGVVISSASASDSGPNACKGILNIHVGSV